MDEENEKTRRSIDWFRQGEERTIELGEHRVVVRFVGRKGRRGRIAITVPPEARLSQMTTKPMGNSFRRKNGP